jgi:Lactoylglutathione lyase and related lyases
MYELDHLGIAVSNCETSALFYTRVLGCSIIERLSNDMLKIIYLQMGNLTLELLEYLNPAAYQRDAGVFDHLALKVNDIDSAILRLKEQGVGFEADAPRLAVNGHKIIFFRGPDGERIELVQS